MFQRLIDIFKWLTCQLVFQKALTLSKWFPKEGDRECGVEIRVEVIGTLSRRNEQPVQNLRVSTKGTVVRAATALPFAENQEIAFLGFYWTINEIQIDLNALNPQAAALGDELKNAVYELTIIASERVPAR